VWLAEAGVEAGHHGIDHLRDAEIGGVAPVLCRAADPHVAQDNAAQAKVADRFEELACAWKERDVRRSRDTQRTADFDPICVCALNTRGDGSL
jgi:hypothetical protein